MNPSNTPRTVNRLPAIDAMRGLVMVLMTVDHASYAFNAGRYVTDSVAWYNPGSLIPAVPFLIRWVTHLCAPTFVFLAGLALAYSIYRKQTDGVSPEAIDRDQMIRGLIILALDPLWMSLGFGGGIIFQVLYAIGGSMVCMVLVRRWPLAAVMVVGVALMLGSEALAGLAIWLGDGQRAGLTGAFLATGGRLGTAGGVLYPLLPWLAYMILGFGCGRMLNDGTIMNPSRWFAWVGIVLLVLFFVIRGLNGYGNMGLYRDDMSLLQWLHVSKYPPSLSFALMTLGAMSLLLAGLFRLNRSGFTLPGAPLTVFGRTPLLFYLLHVHLLSGSAHALGMWKSGGLLETGIAATAVLIGLYPLCRWYGPFKRLRPNTVFKYI